MDLNTSECSLFFGEVCSTSTPVLKNASESGGKTATILSKRKLETSDQIPTKHMRFSITSDSDIVFIENNVSVITINDDTITCGKTLIAPDNIDVENGAISPGMPTEQETLTNDDTRESSIYETISETYCSDATVLSNASSKDSVKLPKLTEENDSVVFVSETFPSYLQSGKIDINQPMQVQNPQSSKAKRLLRGAKRMIIIDGSNVAFTHSAQRKEFSVEGLCICIDYFITKGYDVKAVVPQMRLKRSNSTNNELLEQLKDEGKVIISPCKCLPNGQSLISYDDRFILDLAHKFDGVVISNDNFRDLFDENDDYKRIIQSRIIGYMFCNDVILFPKDPYGRNGPTSDEILTK